MWFLFVVNIMSYTVPIIYTALCKHSVREGGNQYKNTLLCMAIHSHTHILKETKMLMCLMRETKRLKELDSGWRWGWWKKNGCKVTWSTRHKTAGFTETFFRHLTHSVQNQVNLSLLWSLCYFKPKRLSVSLTKLWDDASTEDWRWFHAETEMAAKMYCRMRNRRQRPIHITWSILVKMSSDKETRIHTTWRNLGKWYGHGLCSQPKWPPIPNLILYNNSTTLGKFLNLSIPQFSL